MEKQKGLNLSMVAVDSCAIINKDVICMYTVTIKEYGVTYAVMNKMIHKSKIWCVCAFSHKSSILTLGIILC